MLRIVSLTLVLLLSTGVLLPFADSSAHGLRQNFFAKRQYHHRRHSRAWWRRHRARIARLRAKRREAALLAAHRRALLAPALAPQMMTVAPIAAPELVVVNQPIIVPSSELGPAPSPLAAPIPTSTLTTVPSPAVVTVPSTISSRVNPQVIATAPPPAAVMAPETVQGTAIPSAPSMRTAPVPTAITIPASTLTSVPVPATVPVSAPKTAPAPPTINVPAPAPAAINVPAPALRSVPVPAPVIITAPALTSVPAPTLSSAPPMVPTRSATMATLPATTASVFAEASRMAHASTPAAGPVTSLGPATVARPQLPAGWNTLAATKPGEVRFRTETAAGFTNGQAALDVVAQSRPNPVYLSAREERRLLAGVAIADLRRIVIDKMISDGGWVTNDYFRDVAGQRVFIVTAQTPGDGRSPDKSWNFYFTEINGRIYRLTTNTPQQFADRMATEAESFIATFQASSKPASK